MLLATVDHSVQCALYVHPQDMETSLGHIPKGSAYVYHMYDFNLESDAKFDMYSDGGDFDTYDCYSANWREHLKFRLDGEAHWLGDV